MQQVEETRRPARAVSRSKPRRGASPQADPSPAQESPAPCGVASKLTYSVTEAARALGVSRRTMYELIHREDFPTLKVGNRRLISRELLAEWVRKQASAGRGL